MQLTRRLFVISSISLAFAFPAQAANVPELNLSKTGLALRGIDPVSYFAVGKPVTGRKDLTLTHLGGTYRFSSAENRELFQNDPDAYLPAFGGYCAYGTAVNAKVDGDPNVWHIVDDQLYLNINRSVDRIWQRNVPKYVRDAEKNWPNLRSQ